MINKEEIEPEDITKIEDTEGEKDFDNRFEVLSGLTRVKSGLKKNVTSDYPMAYLGLAEREFITENYQNAEFAKEIIIRFSLYQFPKWDDKLMCWKKNDDNSLKLFPLSKKDTEKIDLMSKRIFEFFMIQPHMIAILNRNKGDNFLVKLLGKYQEEPEKVEYGVDDRNILQKFRDKITGTDDGGGEE